MTRNETEEELKSMMYWKRKGVEPLDAKPDIRMREGKKGKEVGRKR